MASSLFNNIGVASIAIISVMKYSQKLAVPKLVLILPLITHRELLSHLSRSTTTIRSIEKLVADDIAYFSNFSRRFYDNLPLAIEAIQFLIDIEALSYSSGIVELVMPIEYTESMGKRAKRIFRAGENISKLLAETSANLYLNLRIQL